MLRDILVRKTGRSAEEIDRKQKKKDAWFSAREALDYGLIDEVIE